MSAKPRILVTGSAGFIGSNLVRRLKNLDYEVWGVDNYSPYYNPSMKIAREIALGIEGLSINADISDRTKLEEVFRLVKPTVVINLAAQGGVRASRVNPTPYLLTNQVGFLNLIELSKEFDVSKFIYASSSSVYGETTHAPFEESANLPAPKSLYALSKISNEIIAENFSTPNMTKIGLRFFTVYGPWGRPDMAMFRILASSVLGKEFVLTASPTVERDFTFIEDLSTVVESLVRKDTFQNGHELLNVAGGSPYSLSQLFSILDNLGLSLKIRNSIPDSLDVRLTHGSVKKLVSVSLPVPSTPLQSGVEQTAKWISNIDNSQLNDWYEYNS